MEEGRALAWPYPAVFCAVQRREVARRSAFGRVGFGGFRFGTLAFFPSGVPVSTSVTLTVATAARRNLMNE